MAVIDNSKAKKPIAPINLLDSQIVDDTITGSNYADVINSGGGNDRVAGGNGDDIIHGGAGNDIIWGDTFSNSDANDNGQDSLYGDDGDDEVHGGNGKDDVHGGAGNDKLYGDNGVDFLDGGAAADLLNGGNGADLLLGGLGGDVQYGGNGNDTFKITTTSNSSVTDSPFTAGGAWSTAQYTADFKISAWDILADFSGAGGEGDKIDLDQLNSFLTGSGPTKLTWTGTTGSPHGVWTDPDFLYADINGDGVADMKVQVKGVGAGDFVGVNHAPVAANDTNASDAVVEAGLAGAGDPNAAGNVKTNDSDSDGDALTVVGIKAGTAAGPSTVVPAGATGVDIVGTYGTLTIHQDGSWTYLLNNADGDTNGLAVTETGHDVFTYTIEDPYHASTTATLTIDITGANDDVIITSNPQSGSATERADGAADENQLPDHTATGSITYTDADTSDTHTAGAVQQAGDATHLGTFSLDDTSIDTGHGGTVGWTFTVADSALDYLQEGEHLVQHYDVTIDDGHGGVKTDTVTVDLYGKNDAATFTDTAGDDFSVTEDSLSDTTAGGTLHVSDVDHDESAFDTTFTTLGTAGANGHGTFTFDASSGAWTYVLNNNDPALATLDDGHTLTDSYTVKSVDGTAHTIEVTINGHTDTTTQTVETSDEQTQSFSFSFDPPVLGSTASSFVLAGPSDAFHFTGTLDLTVTGDINKAAEHVFLTFENGTQVSFDGTGGAPDPGDPNSVSVGPLSLAFSSDDHTIAFSYHSSAAVGGDTLSVTGTVHYTYDLLV